MNKSKRPPGYPAHAGMRQLGATLFGGLTGHYRALRKRLSDMLGRGDRDYATLSALSQEIGRMRQKIRADLERRRAERKRRKAAKSHTVRRDTGLMKGRHMRSEPRGGAKLAPVLRYGAFALLATWSLLAIAVFAALDVAAGWLGGMTAADGWIAWSGQGIEQAGGPVVAILWLLGTLAIMGAMAGIRRFTD